MLLHYICMGDRVDEWKKGLNKNMRFYIIRWWGGYSNPWLAIPDGDLLLANGWVLSAVFVERLQQAQAHFDIRRSSGSSDLIQRGRNFQLRKTTGKKEGFLRCKMLMMTTKVTMMATGAKMTIRVTVPATDKPKTTAGRMKNMSIK